jgi:hypothetical protein
MVTAGIAGVSLVLALNHSPYTIFTPAGLILSALVFQLTHHE